MPITPSPQGADGAAGALTATLYITEPNGSEDGPEFFTDAGLTIGQLNAVLVGSSTPSVTWTLRFAADRSAAGTEVVTGGTTTTSIADDEITSFNNAAIPAGSYVWLETTAQSGTVASISVTVTPS